MNNDMIERLRVGMRVMSADGYVLGIVCRLIEVDGYTFVEVVAGRDVWKLALRPRRLFLPSNTVAEVVINYALLAIDARAAKAYSAPPRSPAHDAGRARQATHGAGGWDWGGWGDGGWAADGACDGGGGFGGDGGC